MRKLVPVLWMLALLLVVAGCDSSNNEDSDVDVFVGSWTVSQVDLNGLELTDLLFTVGGVDQAGAEFGSSGSFTLFAVLEGTRNEVQGNFTLDETQKTLTVTSSELGAPLVLNYTIDNDNQISVSTEDAGLLAALTNVDLEDLGIQVETVRLVLTRVSS